MKFPDLDAMIAEMDSPEGKASIKASKLEKYAFVEPCLMDRWPPELWSLSFGPNLLIPFPVEDFIDVADGKVSHRLKRYFDQLDGIIAGKPWFIKLSSRSPKDMAHPGVPIVHSGDTAFSMLAGSMRVFDDCCDFAGIQKPLFLVLRTPMTIPQRYEFRCFVKDRELVGITQYFYDQAFDGLEIERQQIEPLIRAFHLKVNDAFPENEYVFDVFFGEDQNGPTLIEVNPYGISDPCLFGTYERVEQGGFLIRTE